ncbi:Uncharacterised protein [Prevotella intermedia]|nr:Uncharacterised protein [Prevotella intermedia]
MYATIAALFVVMFALPTTMHAQTEYDLTICGTKVTSANCNDLSKIDGVSGTAKYDPSSKVLTLQNATISSNTAIAILSYIDGLKINVIGTNNLSTAGNATLSFRKPLTIMGGGVLNAKTQSDCAIYANGTNLTIDNCTVNAESGAYGIAGNNGENEKLTIRKAKVTAIGKEYGSICDFAELNMEGCGITQPVGATFSSSKRGVVLNGEIVKSKVVIQEITKYDLTICGVAVTSANCNDLSKIDGVSGTVNYDPSNKLLTLQGATISSNTTNAILSYIDGLKINVIGTNNLSTAGNATLSFRNPLFILGGGVLNVKSKTDCAIYANGTNLTIDNCTVNAESGAYGIAGNNGENEKLTIRKAKVTAIGTGNGSICDFAELNMEGCGITQPVGATFSSSKHGVVLNGEIVKSKVVIQELTKYDLTICGVAVTSANCNDLSVIDGVSGTVKYNPVSKTLTLDNARISCDERVPFFSDIDGLTIKVVGTNNLTTTTLTTISLFQPVTITGGGVLNAKSGSNCAIYAYRTHLTIDNCTVNAEGGDYGIAGNDGSSEKLTIKNATVTAVGTKKGSICDLAEFETIGCEITQPTGATFDSSKRGVVLNGELVKSKVVIKKDPTAIETPTADNTAVQGIYTLSGVRMSGELKDLPKGVYVVNGKKVVKQ